MDSLFQYFFVVQKQPKCIQYFIVWSFVSTSLECLPADSIINEEITKTDHNKSYDVDYATMDHKYQHFTELTTFPAHLIAESRLPHKRVKRVHVFRPLFVYRQEQIKRKRIVEKRKQRSRKTHDNSLSAERSTPKPKPCTCCNKCHQRY